MDVCCYLVRRPYIWTVIKIMFAIEKILKHKDQLELLESPALCIQCLVN